MGIRKATESTDIPVNIMKENANIFAEYTKAATGVVLPEKVVLEILQYSQENTSARVSFFSKVAGWGL